MAKHQLGQCKTRVQLGMHAAKAALDKCNLKMQEAVRDCEGNGGNRFIELGESPGSDADAQVKAEEEQEELHKECAALENEIQRDLEGSLQTQRSLGLEVGLKESQCHKLNKKLELSMEHRCCTGKLVSGCPLVGVQGDGGAKNLQCRHFTPTGPQSACYYSEVYFDKESDTYTGNQTVQNQARTNFVQCTTWEYSKNVQELERWTHVGFNGNTSGDGAEEWKKWHRDDDFVNIPDPFAEEEAKQAQRKAGNIVRSDLGSDNSTQLDDKGTVSVQAGENRNSWTTTGPATTSISVHALVKSIQQCTMCGKVKVAGNRTDLRDINAPNVRLEQECDHTENQRATCARSKVVQCQKICFLIGNRNSGASIRSQDFREEECPVNQHISSNVTGDSADKDWELVPNGMLTATPGHYGKVTLETIVDAELPKFASEEEQKNYLQHHYQSEDVGLKQCCFPGCKVPRKVLAGKFFGTDNPWYWYNRELTLATGVSMQFVYQY